jgi:hypothetical protein
LQLPACSGSLGTSAELPAHGVVNRVQSQVDGFAVGLSDCKQSAWLAGFLAIAAALEYVDTNARLSLAAKLHIALYLHMKIEI